MSASPSTSRIKRDVLALVEQIPAGRVTTFDAIGNHLGILPQQVSAVLTALSPDERDAYPWCRVVAKGGAIGRGPHRDAQFARLVREGVTVSPAGIVQDLAARRLETFTGGGRATPPPPTKVPEKLGQGRSRGMKDRP